jgi:hypothetical protein
MEQNKQRLRTHPNNVKLSKIHTGKIAADSRKIYGKKAEKMRQT